MLNHIPQILQPRVLLTAWLCESREFLFNVRGTFVMCVLEVTEFSLLELAAFRPFSYLPSNHRAAAERLRQRGLLRQENDQWHPTSVGLAVLGHTLH